MTWIGLGWLQGEIGRNFEEKRTGNDAFRNWIQSNLYSLLYKMPFMVNSVGIFERKLEREPPPSPHLYTQTFLYIHKVKFKTWNLRRERKSQNGNLVSFLYFTKLRRRDEVSTFFSSLSLSFKIHQHHSRIYFTFILSSINRQHI